MQAHPSRRMTMDHRRLLAKIMGMDEYVRYGTVCDMDGRQVCESRREGLQTYLSPEETQDTLRHAADAWRSRVKHYDKIGRGLYTMAVYEKLRRVTFPLRDGHLLLITIDNKGGRGIVDRILNELYGDYTMD